jgi:hypothetical protein
MTNQFQTPRRHITVVQTVQNVDANSTVVGIVTTGSDLHDVDLTVTQAGENIAAGVTVVGAVITGRRADLDPNDTLTIPIAQDQ